MKSILLVFVGGGLGAIIRELFKLSTEPLLDSFPVDILLANILAAFLLGLAAAWHARKKLGDDAYLFIGTGVMGGLSTFSSFVYGAVVLMFASTLGIMVSIFYLIFSVIVGYGAVSLGYRLSR